MGVVIACMGGWCRHREKCAHYHSASRVITERLCPPDHDEPEPLKPPPQPSEKCQS